MNSSNSRPKWWQMYLIFPLLISLFIMDHQLKVSTRAHEAVQIGILLLVYGLMYWWIHANSIALSRMDQKQYYGRVVIVQVPRPQLSEAKEERYPILQLPTSEVKGILDNTFEMESTAADVLPVSEASQQLNKE